MEIWDKILETIKTLMPLAWPAVALGAVILFRKQLGDVISRVRKAGPTGFELESPPAQQTPDTVPPPPATTVGRTVLPDPSEPVKALMEMLAGQLENLPEKDPKQREQLLIRALAESQNNQRLEQIYTNLFGSQIALLRRLHEQGRTTKAEVQAIYDMAAGAFPQFYKGYSFDQWLTFLIQSQLITVEGVAVKPTPLVKDFLLYITHRHLPDAKLG